MNVYFFVCVTAEVLRAMGLSPPVSRSNNCSSARRSGTFESLRNLGVAKRISHAQTQPVWDCHRTADQLGWCQGGQCKHIVHIWSVWDEDVGIKWHWPLFCSCGLRGLSRRHLATKSTPTPSDHQHQSVWCLGLLTNNEQVDSSAKGERVSLQKTSDGCERVM